MFFVFLAVFRGFVMFEFFVLFMMMMVMMVMMGHRIIAVPIVIHTAVDSHVGMGSAR